MTLREATRNDCAALTELITELGYPTVLADMETRMAQISSHPDYTTLVAELEGGVVGVIGLVRGLFFEKNGTYLRIVLLVTKSEHREQGIGKLLLARAEQIAAAENIKTILVNSGTRPERAAAYQFYQKMGYEVRSSGFVKYI